MNVKKTKISKKIFQKFAMSMTFLWPVASAVFRFGPEYY